MFRVGMLRCQGTGTLRIMMLASLTISLLLSINTINCIASQNNSRSKTTEDVGGSTTSNGNEGIRSTIAPQFSGTSFLPSISQQTSKRISLVKNQSVSLNFITHSKSISTALQETTSTRPIEHTTIIISSINGMISSDATNTILRTASSVSSTFNTPLRTPSVTLPDNSSATSTVHSATMASYLTSTNNASTNKRVSSVSRLTQLTTKDISSSRNHRGSESTSAPFSRENSNVTATLMPIPQISKSSTVIAFTSSSYSNTTTNSTAHNTSFPTPSVTKTVYLNHTETESIAVSNVSIATSAASLHTLANFTATPASNNMLTNKTSHNSSFPTPSITKPISSYVTGTESMATRFLRTMTAITSLGNLNVTATSIAVSNTPASSVSLRMAASSATTIAVSNSSIMSSKTLTAYNRSIAVSIVSMATSPMTTPLPIRPSFTATPAGNKSITSTTLLRTMASYPSNISGTPTSNLWRNTTLYNTSLPTPSVTKPISSYLNHTETESVAATVSTTVTGIASSRNLHVTATTIAVSNTSVVSSLSLKMTAVVSSTTTLTVSNSSVMSSKILTLHNISASIVVPNVSMTTTPVSTPVHSLPSFTATPASASNKSITSQTMASYSSNILATPTTNMWTSTTARNTSLPTPSVTKSISSHVNHSETGSIATTFLRTMIGTAPLGNKNATATPIAVSNTSLSLRMTATASSSTTTMTVSNSSMMLLKTTAVYNSSIAVSNVPMTTPLMTASLHTLANVSATPAKSIISETMASYSSNISATPTSDMSLSRTAHNTSLPTPSVTKSISSYLNQTETDSVATTGLTTMTGTSLGYSNATLTAIAVFNTSVVSSPSLRMTAIVPSTRTMAVSNSSVMSSKILTIYNTTIGISNVSLTTSPMTTPLHVLPSFTATPTGNKSITSKTMASFSNYNISATPASNMWTNRTANNTSLLTVSVTKPVSSYLNQTGIKSVAATVSRTVTGIASSRNLNVTATTIAASNTSVVSSFSLRMTATASSTTTMSVSNSSVMLSKTLTAYTTSIAISNVSMTTPSMTTPLHTLPNVTATPAVDNSITSKTMASYSSNISATSSNKLWTNSTAHNNTSLLTPSVAKPISSYLNHTGTESIATRFLRTRIGTTSLGNVNATATPTAVSITFVSSLSLNMTATASSPTTMTVSNSSVMSSKTTAVYNSSIAVSNVSVTIPPMTASLHTLANFTATPAGNKSIISETMGSYSSNISATPTSDMSLNRTSHNTSLPTPLVTKSISSYLNQTEIESVATTVLSTMTGTKSLGYSKVPLTPISVSNTYVSSPSLRITAIESSTTTMTVSNSSVMSSKTLTIYNTSIAVSNVSTTRPTVATPLHTLPSFTATPAGSKSITSTALLRTMTSYVSNISVTATSNLWQYRTATPPVTNTISSYANRSGTETVATRISRTMIGSTSLGTVNTTATRIVVPNTSVSSLSLGMTAVASSTATLAVSNSSVMSSVTLTAYNTSIAVSDVSSLSHRITAVASSTAAMAVSNSSVMSSVTLTAYNTSIAVSDVSSLSLGITAVASSTTTMTVSNSSVMPSVTLTAYNTSIAVSDVSSLSHRITAVASSTAAMTVSNSSVMPSVTLTAYNTSIATATPSLTTPLHIVPSFTSTPASNNSITSAELLRTMTSYPSNISATPASNLSIIGTANNTSLPTLWVTKSISSYVIHTETESIATTFSRTMTGTTSLRNLNVTATPIGMFSTYVVTLNTTIPFANSLSSTMIAITASSFTSSISVSPTSSFLAATERNMTSSTYVNSPLLSNTIMSSLSLNFSSSTVTSTAETNRSALLSTSTLISLTSLDSTSSEKLLSSTVPYTVNISSSWAQPSNSPVYTVSSDSDFGSSTISSVKLLSSASQSYMERKSSSGTLLSSSYMLTFTSKRSSEIKTTTSMKLLTSTTLLRITTRKPLTTSTSEMSPSSSSFSKISRVSSMVSSTGSIISSTISYIENESSRSTELPTSQWSSTPKTTTKSTKLSKVSTSLHTIVPSSSFALFSNTISVTSTVPYVSQSSSRTVIVAEEFRVQIILLIPLSVLLNDIIFMETLRKRLEELFNLGLTKTTLFRKRREINDMIFPLSHSGRNSNLRKMINQDLDVPKRAESGRFRRQIGNETKVEIVNVTRTVGDDVQVTFYVKRGGELVSAKQAAKVLNAPSENEKVATLGYSVKGEFSPVVSKEKTESKKKDETLLIVLAVCIPVLFVFGACIFIKCKKKKRTRKMKLNKVSIEQPREKVSVAESANEERYTRAPTLPMKDYPDVIIQTPERRKQRTKKAKAPKVQKLERENLHTAAPAAAFENITRLSFDSPSNVAIDGIPLRLRPAVRQEVEEPESKDIIEDSGVPRSSVDNKTRVDMKSSNGDLKDEEKMSTDTPKSVAGADDADTDDTIQIKANIEKWRNKMRQREKRKEHREERKRAKQEKLIALEEKKLSRREWLMAQPEIQAILDGDDLSKPASSRKKKHRRERWPESRKHPDSDSDDEVMVVPVRRQHRRRWPQRSARRVYPSERDGVRLIAVRPKKQRVYAFEEPSHEEEIEQRYIPAQDGSVPFQRPSEPVINEAFQFREEYGYSPDSVYDDEFYDPYVPEYGEPRYYQPPRTRYVATQVPVTLEQQLPLRMAETSFVGTPQRPEREHGQIGPRQAPRGMYFEQPPRPSSLYSRAKKSPNARTSDTIPEETGHASSKDIPEGPVPSSQNTTPRPTTPSPGKSNMDISNKSDTSLGRSWDSKTDEDFLNYSISENEARKLVSRVLDRAKGEADKR